MTAYNDAAHAIARAMSIETNDGTAKSGWQMRYQAGFPEPRGNGTGLSPDERLTQDAITRAILHKYLPEAAWHAIVAKYSINDVEVRDSVLWLIRRVQSPAHHLFKTKCVTAWAIPRRLPDAFYVLHSWDADGTPERTLREWRSKTRRWLEMQVNVAFESATLVLEEKGLIEQRDAA
ncbi:hypothetical protein [Pseudomonas sp. Marseille-QA0892]